MITKTKKGILKHGDCGGHIVQHPNEQQFFCLKCQQFVHKDLIRKVSPDKNDLLLKLRKETESCGKCILHNTRKELVFGVGNPNAKLFFIGEAPGEKEDEAGEPFVGSAGEVLERLLEGIGLTREEVYITNTVCCHPPKNRDPDEYEVEVCKPRLLKQIKIVGPAIICTLGKVAINALLKKQRTAIKGIHGKAVKKKRIVFISYHPSYATYNSNNYSILEKDFEKLGKIYRRIK